MQLVEFHDDAFVPVKDIVCVKKWEYDPRNDYVNAPEPEYKYYVKVSFINQDYITTEFKTKEEQEEWYNTLKKGLEQRKE